MKANNDNEIDTFEPLAMAVASLVRRLETHDDARDHPADVAERSAPKNEVGDPEQRDAYIDAGLERMRRFERRYRSKRPRG